MSLSHYKQKKIYIYIYCTYKCIDSTLLPRFFFFLSLAHRSAFLTDLPAADWTESCLSFPLDVFGGAMVDVTRCISCPFYVQKKSCTVPWLLQIFKKKNLFPVDINKTPTFYQMRLN